MDRYGEGFDVQEKIGLIEYRTKQHGHIIDQWKFKFKG